MHYLDNSATTKPCDEAVHAMRKALETWGNPSSVYHIGKSANDALASYRRCVAKTLGVQKFSRDRIFFTSCGTESNNIAMTGCILSKKRAANADGIYGTIIISAGEHPSIDAPAARLENSGYKLVRVPTAHGVLDIGYLENALENAKKTDAPVIFAGFMLVNNETGAIYDVKSAAALVKRYFPDANVHCDAVQGYLKLPFTPYTLGVDTMTVSAHKIHAPRGAAALFVSENIIKRKNLVPVMPGGGQEEGYRSGTENLIGIAGFAAAAEIGYNRLSANMAKVQALRERLDDKLSGMTASGIKQNVTEGAQLSNIASIVLPGIRSETMLNYLSSREIYVSAGSACSARSKKKSAALTAFGVSDYDADSTLRVSISHTNDECDIDALCEALLDGTAALQKK